VRNHHDDAKTAEGFAQANLQIGAQPGLIAELVGSHEQAKGEIVKALTALTSVCEASSAELDRTRQMYDRVDAGSAERLDQTYPDPGSPPQMPSVPGLPADTSTQAVRQMASPAERPKPPQAADFTNPIQLVNDLGKLISAGYRTQQFLDTTIQVNPVEEFSNWVAGDWEQFAKASDALNSLAFFCADLAQDLKTNITTLLTSWTGNAANEAFQYFSGLADTSVCRLARQKHLRFRRVVRQPVRVREGHAGRSRTERLVPVGIRGQARTAPPPARLRGRRGLLRSGLARWLTQRNDSPLFDADAILRKAYFGVSSAIPIGRGRCPSSRPRSHWPRTTACASRIAAVKPCSWWWRPWCSSWSQAQCSAWPCAWLVLDNDLRVPPAGFEPATPALGEQATALTMGSTCNFALTVLCDALLNITRQQRFGSRNGS
jgi:hypothetical protein